MALGTYSGSLPTRLVPGRVGCQVYLCTSCTLINLCKSPTPAPPCFCAFAHSPQAPRASLVLLPQAPGSGMDRGHLLWNQQGVPFMGPSPPPSRSHLVHYPSGCNGSAWHWEVVRATPPPKGGKSCPLPHLTAECAGRRRPHSDGQEPSLTLFSPWCPHHDFTILVPAPLAESALSNCIVFLAVGEDLFVGVSLV